MKLNATLTKEDQDYILAKIERKTTNGKIYQNIASRLAQLHKSGHTEYILHQSTDYAWGQRTNRDKSFNYDMVSVVQHGRKNTYYVWLCWK